MERWPDFFIIGAPRSGTTSLHSYLRKHPDVFMPDRREPYFFSPVTKSPKFMQRVQPVHDREAYLALFLPARASQLTGEASTSYLWDPDAPRLIHEANPQAKVIAILRDPVERVFSHYLMYRQKHGESRTFEQFVNEGLREGADNHDRHHIESGFYFRNLQRYVSLFGKENVHVIPHRELRNDPQGMYDRLCDFLGISRLKLPAFPANNPTYAVSDGWIGKLQELRKRYLPFALPIPGKLKARFRKRYLKPKPDPETEKKLKALYAEDAERMRQWLGDID